MHFYGCCTSILNFYSRNISDLGNKGRKQFPCYISNISLFLAAVGLNNAKIFLWCHGILQLLQVLQMESVKCKNIFIKVMHFSASSSVQLWHFSICVSC